MLKRPLKTKYKVTAHHPQVFKDEELTKDLVLKSVDKLDEAIQVLIDARMYQSSIGNLLQFCEENDIRIKDKRYKNTMAGGYWIYDDE